MSIDFNEINVTDRKSFIEFLFVLQQELISNADEWENKSLSDYLEAVSRYAEDIDGFYLNTGQEVDAEQASWKLFADILKGASVYE
ncbi:hypothetical protein F1C16_16425 [Hymenobacter sp. NBH84]|uniref:DUF7660 family protein n=1 Tax=Hymenobacter sp. NBH84 TaxID=2596915 RepID=UPI001625E045|nr:hypothetical protein [Hymenobacter sp. NBH84]QNE41040.1 hypothetical protein F1C16_16425 [Hymenobacter sp. NBH84]